jgi:hypothetical protein
MSSGLAIAFISILLAVPLSVVANLLTPRVQRLWGNTSRSRKIKRIAHIKNELMSMALLDLTRELLRQGMFFMLALAVAMMSTADLGLMSLVPQERRTPHLMFKLSVTYAVVGLMASTITFVISGLRLARLHLWSYPQHASGLQKELEKLEYEVSPPSTPEI